MLNINTLDPRQERIFKWINDTLRLPAYADLFGGAAKFLKQKPPGYVTFVAHAGREMMNGLARTYRGDVRQQVQYVNRLNEIEVNWDDAWGAPVGFSDTEEPSHHAIPRAICVKLHELIEDHRTGRRRSEETNEVFFLTFLNYLNGDEIPGNFITEWKDAKRWFQEHAHAREELPSGEAVTQIEKHFSFLESMLEVAAGSQYERIKGLDEILAETNR